MHDVVEPLHILYLTPTAQDRFSHHVKRHQHDQENTLTKKGPFRDVGLLSCLYDLRELQTMYLH